MTTAPLISCIVPARNAVRYLRETLDSILAQTYQPIEVIVADGRSTDGTGDLARSYGSRIVYVWNEGDTGAPSGRNVGLAHARGEYIAFLDADDLWHPEKLALQMARLEADTTIDVSLTYLENFWSPDLPADQRWFKDGNRAMVLAGYSPATMLTRMDVFGRYGYWDATQGHAANSEWFVRARDAGAKIDLLQDVLVRRRLHATNLSRAHEQSYEDHFRLVKASLDRRRAAARASAASISDANPALD
jgi:glycosyltransferase involved in cell wall biosynthesis